MTGLRPSRRTLTKGAIWTAPAVAVASAAPAYAVSINNEFTCGCLTHTGASAPTYTVAAQGGNIFTGSSVVQLNLGNLFVAATCRPSNTTGFTFNVVSMTATDQSGGQHVGTVNSSTNTPLVGGAGGALATNVTFPTFAYNAPGADPDWDANHYLASYAFTYTVSYLNGLNVAKTVTCNSSVTANPNLTHIGGTLSRFA